MGAHTAAPEHTFVPVRPSCACGAPASVVHPATGEPLCAAHAIPRATSMCIHHECKGAA
jgi:hypothetical protein